MIGAVDPGALDASIPDPPGPPPERVGDAQIEGLLAQLDQALTDLEMLPDGDARTASVDALQMLLLVYGEAMQRVVDKVGAIAGEHGMQALMNDRLLDQLMVLHDVHPQDLDTRAERALAQVRPYLQSHGGDVEFLGIDDGVARLRLTGSCDGCPSSTVTLKSAVEEALKAAMPEVVAVEAEGEDDAVAPAPSEGAFIPASQISFGRPGGSGVAKSSHAN